MTNPCTGKVIAEEVQGAGAKDVDLAVLAASNAFKNWSRTRGSERARCMLKMADLVEADMEKLAMIETISMGQPISTARKFMEAVPAYWRYYAGFADKIGGESFPEDGDARIKFTQSMPYGVCAGIGRNIPPNVNKTSSYMCSILERHPSHGCQETSSRCCGRKHFHLQSLGKVPSRRHRTRHIYQEGWFPTWGHQHRFRGWLYRSTFG